MKKNLVELVAVGYISKQYLLSFQTVISFESDTDVVLKLNLKI